MNNEIANELASYRVQRLERVPFRAITEFVGDQLEHVQPGSINGLQGLDAEMDGVTKPLWDQAVTVAHMNGMLLFGSAALDKVDHSDLPLLTYEEVVDHVARRVAKAILVINGYRD